MEGAPDVVVDVAKDKDDGTAIPRILERIRERRSAFTLAAISSSVSAIIACIFYNDE